MRYKRVLFIQPHYRGSQSPGPFINTGLGYISESLSKNGVDNVVFDMALGYKKEDLNSKINDYAPELIGISLMSMQYKKNYILTKYLKKYFKDIPIIVGGSHASTFREKMLIECSSIDFGVVGDGEKALLNLCLGNEIETIPGLIYRDKDGHVHYKNEPIFLNDLDKITFPRYEKFELDKYGSIMPIVTSRGCPYECVFCPIKTVAGRKFRRRCVENILDELEYWLSQNRKEFTIRDDNFTFDKNRVYEFCDGIEKRKLKNLNFKLNNGIRADRCDRELLKRMKGVGFSEIAFGVEAANNYVLKKIKKGQNIEVIEQAIKNACDLGFYINLFFMIGLPGEKWEDIEKKAELALRYPVSDVSFYNIVPFPDTELYRWIESNNLFLVKPEEYLNYPSPHWINKPLFQTEELSKSQRKKAFRYLNSKIKHRVRARYYKRKYGLIGALYFTITHNILVHRMFLRYKDSRYFEPLMKARDELLRHWVIQRRSWCMGKNKKKIIFIFWREEVKTGGERMDFCLWEIAKKNYAGVRLIELDSISQKFPKRLIKIIYIKYLGRAIKMLFYAITLPKERSALIYTHFNLSRFLFFYLLIMRYFYSSKIIMYNHLIDYSISECLNTNKGKLFIENSFMRVANIILTNSIYSRDKLLTFGIPERKIRIIYPLLLDLPGNDRPRPKKENSKITLLFIGTVFLRKGLKSLLEAMAILDRRDIFLNIVGDANKEFNFKFIETNRDLIKRLEARTMIKFLSEVMEVQRKEELFTQANIFVMPSLSEGFGIVFAEAMSYCLPIIAADTTATPELVREGYNGILVPPEDSKALAGAIEALADNKELRIKMGNNGYKMIKDFYESYSIENEFCSVLEGLQI